MEKLKVLDLFSGIGGFSLGLERTGGFETVAFCEYDEKAQKVLKKHWPDVPIYKDVRTLEHDGTIDVISGGFPCQPFSVAGKQKGKDDDRHLWPAMFKLIQKHRPTWVIGENVAGLIALGLDSVLIDLESEGYTVRTFLIPAVAVNAPHRRDRVWIVGHSEHDGSSSCGNIGQFQGEPEWTQKTIFEFEGTSRPKHDEVMADTESKRKHGEYGDNSSKARKDGCGDDKLDSRSEHSPTIVADTELWGVSLGRGSGEISKNINKSNRIFGYDAKRSEQQKIEILADATSKRQPRQGQYVKQMCSEKNKEREADNAFSSSKGFTWPLEPSVGRVANGIPRRVDRLKQLGNAVVPQIPEIIGNAILDTYNAKQKT
jgi:DNA (cytosine-5)-methyltransferase 1